MSLFSGNSDELMMNSWWTRMKKKSKGFWRKGAYTYLYYYINQDLPEEGRSEYLVQYTQAGHCWEPLASLSVAASADPVFTAVEASGLVPVCESEQDRSMGELGGSATDDDDDRLLLLDLSWSDDDDVTAAVSLAVVVAATAVAAVTAP